LLLNHQFGVGYNSLVLLLIIPYVVFIKELYARSQQPFSNIAFTLLGIVYVAAPLLCCILIPL
jgi:phosphatidate cytidylyltransferase